MKIEELISKQGITQSDDTIISELKKHRNTPLPNIEKAKRALDPDKHDVMDKQIRPDKKIKIEKEDGTTEEKTELVARVAIALQKLIITRAVSFLFGNQVNYNSTPQDEQEELVAKSLKRILYDVKSNSLNRKVARSVFGFKECAELWYPVEKTHKSYGFDSKFKLRCAIFSPKNGDTLYPYFDATDDMIAFSRAFSRKGDDGSVINYFETYTDEEHALWSGQGSSMKMVEGYPKKLTIGKIPIVYGHQELFETEDVDALIARLEKLLSNFADTNDYHASPKIFVKGALTGFSKKGEAGAIIEGEENSDAKYLAWQNAPESVRLEIETLLKFIYTISQTPDISFDSVKGLGALSGISLKLLFMDAHLKVQDKKEVFDEYLQRRVNVIKSYIGSFNLNLQNACEEMEIEPEITPYMLTSEIDELNYWMTANGNNPVISQEESVEKAGLSSDPAGTFNKIQEESQRNSSFMIGEPIEA